MNELSPLLSSTLKISDRRERVQVLNNMTKFAEVALGVELYQIRESEEYKAWGYAEFKDYWEEEIKRSKGDVSKLCTVGEFMVANGFLGETPDAGYTTLYKAIKANPEKSPKYILAQAATWTESDFKAEKKEDGHEHMYESFCKVCWRKP